jgi:N-methylhydantoinase A
LLNEGFPNRKQKHERSLAVRYKGQSFELQIKQTTGNIAAAFHRAHQSRYGYAQTENAVEIVSARVRSVGVVDKFRIRREKIKRKALARPQKIFKAYFDRKKAEVAVYRREELAPGARLRTPCIVTEYSGTTLMPSAALAYVDDLGNLSCEVSTARKHGFGLI